MAEDALNVVAHLKRVPLVLSTMQSEYTVKYMTTPALTTGTLIRKSRFGAMSMEIFNKPLLLISLVKAAQFAEIVTGLIGIDAPGLVKHINICFY